MKIYLDDERPTPEGWVGCRWPSEVIYMLKRPDLYPITHISLDHDLGDAENALRENRKEITGYDVLLFIEEQVSQDFMLGIPEIYIHTANSSAHMKMLSALGSIKKNIKERLTRQV